MKEIEPLISVILTTYNCSNFLDKVVLSLLNQTYRNCEFLILDDASTDNTTTLLNSYAKKDQRIRLFLQKENKGAYILRNLGLKEMKGEYLIFCDSDDYYQDLNAFKKLYEAILTSKADIAMGAVDIYDNQTKEVIKKKEFTSIPKEKEDSLFISYSFLASKGFLLRISLFSKLFLTSIIKNNKISFLAKNRFGEDFIFSLEYYMKCKNGLIFIEDPLYLYRINTGSNITSNVDTSIQRLKQWNNIFDLYKKENTFETSLDEILYVFYYGTAGTIFSSRQDKFLMKKEYFEVHHNISKNLPTHKIPKKVDPFNRLGLTLNKISPNLGFPYYYFFYNNNILFKFLSGLKKNIYSKHKRIKKK